MAVSDITTHPVIASIENQGRRFVVTCRIAFDGIEHVGRLWFTEEGGGDSGLPDRGAISGRTREEVIALAKRFTTQDLLRRHRRATAEKRKFIKLRRVTDDIVAKIRYMNQIALAARSGLLDADGAGQEMELTEQQLHDCIGRLRAVAGIEE
jgi:hypothetical protein